MTADPTDPTAQLKLILGELVVTIANLEAQKAALTAALAAELASAAKEAPVASL